MAYDTGDNKVVIADIESDSTDVTKVVPKEMGDHLITMNLLIKDFEFALATEKIYKVSIYDDFINNRYPLIMIRLKIILAEYIALRALYTTDTPILNNVDFTCYVTDRTIPNSGQRVARHFANMKAVVDKIDKISENENKLFLAEKQNNNTDTSIFVTLTLFNEDEIRAFNKGDANGVYKDVTMNDVMYKAFLDTSNVKLKFCPVPSDNTNVYSQVIIPPFGFYDVLKYLNSEYTLYKTDYNVYISDGVVYLYPCYQNINISHSDKEKNREVHLEVKDGYELNTVENINKYTEKILDLSIAKTHITYKPNYNILKRTISIVDINKFIKNTDDYEYIHSLDVEHSSEENSTPHQVKKLIHLSFTIKANIPDWIVYPFTKFKVVHQEYGGDYRIATHHLMLSNVGISRTITLYKIL